MKIVFLDSMTIGKDVDLSAFNRLGDFIVYENSTRDEAAARIADADIVLSNKVVLDEKTLCNAHNVKLIAVTATGYNNVDIEYAKSRNIAVTNVAGYSTDSVVQHTFALLLHLYEKLEYYIDYTKSGKYTKSPMFCHLGRTFSELSGKTWGIIGLGTIGRKVAQIATAFGCKVIYYSTTGKNHNSDYEEVDFEQLLSRSDIISIHSALTERTRHLMNYDAFSSMKNSAVVINVGRGPIIDEKDLVKALKENQIAGAALDVIEMEPMTPDCPLLELSNDERLIITPHVAWATFEARTRLMELVYDNIESFLKGEKKNRVV